MVPPCDGQCQLRKPCRSWCENLRATCLDHPSIKEILNHVVAPASEDGTESEVRMMAKSMVGKRMDVVDSIVKKLLECGGSEGGVTFSDEEATCAKEDNEDFNTCKPEEGSEAPTAQMPLKVEEAQVEEAQVEEVVDTLMKNSSSVVDTLMKNSSSSSGVDVRCVQVVDPLDPETTYFGALDKGTQADYTGGVTSLKGLLGFVGGMIDKKCVEKIISSLSTWLAPSCDGDCMPRQPCASWCTRLMAECLPAHVVGMLGQVMPGGPLRSVVEGQVPSAGSLAVLDQILGMVSNGCDGDNFSSDDKCQKEVDTPSCSPQTTETQPSSSLANVTTVVSDNNDDDVGIGGTQKMMGSVVEGAVDSAKGEIGSLVPKIESEILKQEDSLAGQLGKAEESLVGKADKNLSSTVNEGTQRMMGSVVEGAVDSAKGEIGKLVPTIEREILKQEEVLDGQLEKAEKSLVGESDNNGTRSSTTEEEKKEKEEKEEKEEVKKKKKKEEEEEEEEEEEKEDHALLTNSTTNQAIATNSTDSADSATDVVEPSSKPIKYSDARRYIPPSWQKDVVVDMDAGVAMRMLDDQSVKPL